MEATAPDLTLPQASRITLRSGVANLDLQLRVASTTQQVTVQDSAGPSVSMDNTANANAVVLKGDDLDALADDPDDLQADLQALAGPSAGPNGGSMFVDGFSGGAAAAEELDSRDPDQSESVFAGVRPSGIRTH